MLATLISAAATCLAALVLGEGLLRLCGHRAWSWQAPPVGLASLILIAVPAPHMPGRAATTAAVIGLLALAGLVLLVRDPGLRPPASGLLAGLPVALLALVPFAAAGRSGTLGVGFDNDMMVHLMQAASYASEDVARVSALDSSYPLGLHALVASVAEGLGGSIDHTFAGVIVATPVLLGWTALGTLRRVGWLGQMAVASVVGMTYLVASFYGEGAFKEVVLATMLLGLALALLPGGRSHGPLRWIPVGLMVAGMLSVYSYPGLLWAGAIGFVWLAGLALTELRRGATARAVAAARGELGSLLIASGVLVVLIAPQLPRLARFYSDVSSSGSRGLDTSALGNLIGRLPLWETFGIWNSADFRIAPPDALTAGAWAALMLAVAIYGAGWWARRGDWAMPAATAASFMVWVFADRTQSPYLASKALVMLSPFVLLLAIRPLVERRSWAPGVPRWWGLAAPLLVLVLVVKVLGSSVEVLRASPVGPRDHMLELRALRSQLAGRRTLFLGDDDFIRWEMAGVPIDAAVIGFPTLPLRPQKPWTYGQAIDVDTVETSELNRVDWVIAPRDAAASAMPSELKLVDRTRNFELWRRVATVPDRRILRERDGAAGARLDCRTPAGRALSRSSGIARVRTPPVVVPAPTVLGPDAEATVRLPLPRGRWSLMASYGSSFPIAVSAPGLHTTLAANLDRPGVRWPIGTIRLDHRTIVSLHLHVGDTTLAPSRAAAGFGAIVAARTDDARTIPLHAACGRYVDWYHIDGPPGTATGTESG